MAIGHAVGADGPNLILTVTGRLGLTDVAGLHTRLLKCLAEQPDALLVDVSDLVVDEPLALSVFTAAARQAARWPGTPVLLCGPSPDTREALAGPAYHRLAVFADVAAARLHLGRANHTLPTLLEELLPVAGAARHARDVATDACLRWELGHLVAPASHIASELVANVVDHAHTMMTLRLSLRPRFLNIAVRDGSPTEPDRPGRPGEEAPEGRGLLLVSAIAHSWGCVPSEDGKVVWAALRR